MRWISWDSKNNPKCFWLNQQSFTRRIPKVGVPQIIPTYTVSGIETDPWFRRYPLWWSPRLRLKQIVHCLFRTNSRSPSHHFASHHSIEIEKHFLGTFTRHEPYVKECYHSPPSFNQVDLRSHDTVDIFVITPQLSFLLGFPTSIWDCPCAWQIKWYPPFWAGLWASGQRYCEPMKLNQLSCETRRHLEPSSKTLENILSMIGSFWRRK